MKKQKKNKGPTWSSKLDEQIKIKRKKLVITASINYVKVAHDLFVFRGYVLDLLESGQKFLLFGHHQELLDAVEAALDQKVFQIFFQSVMIRSWIKFHKDGLFYRAFVIQYFVHHYYHSHVHICGISDICMLRNVERLFVKVSPADCFMPYISNHC